MIRLTREMCEQALLGGLLLGGGGGGSLTAGREALEEAFRHTDALTMLEISELAPDDIVVNVSVVGAPSAMGMHLTEAHWMTALKNFELNCQKKISGFTTCENGALSTSNGWLISALTGIPLVDAPSDGRAHPTGTMGSIGLNAAPGYLTTQSSCGGVGDRYVENVARGSLTAAAHMVRQSAVADGGMVAVLRNPVTAEYLAGHAAVGAIAQALEIGGMFRASAGGTEFVRQLEEKMDARVLCRGRIRDCTLRMEGGYDIGGLKVSDGGSTVDLLFWNEYMLAEQDGQRVATFPDLICTLDAGTGEAISTAEAADGRDVYALVIPKKRLILGAGLRQRSLIEDVERLLKKDMTSCNEDLFTATT